MSAASVSLELTEGVGARARAYETSGIRSLDALHLAFAVEHRIPYFCSVDHKLLSKAKAVETALTKVVSLLDFVEIQRQ